MYAEHNDTIMARLAGSEVNTQQMDTVARFQILYKAVYFSHRGQIFWKGMYPNSFLPSLGK